MKTKLHNTAGCFLIRKNKAGVWEIVLIYKKWAEDNQGWVPPKGHVAENETLEEAARRETREETGYINFKIQQPLKTLYIEYPWDDGYIHKKSIHYFLAILKNEEKDDLKLSENEQNSTQKVDWLSLEQAKRELKFDDEREILESVIEIVEEKL